MSEHTPRPQANQRYLVAALAGVRAALAAHAAPNAADASDSVALAQRELEAAAAALPAPGALDVLCERFGLSVFERALLLLCAGVELEGDFAALCAAAQNDPQRPYPTFGLALAALPEPHWDAIAPVAALRRYRLIEVGPGGALVASRLRIDERVLHFLANVDYLDERLAAIVDELPSPQRLAPSHAAVAQQVAGAWAQHNETGALPVIQLCAAAIDDALAVAAAACAMLGLAAHALPAARLPLAPADLDALARLWEREAALANSALVLCCDGVEGEPARQQAISWLAERIGGAVILAAPQRHQLRGRPVLTFEPLPPPAPEQRALWRGGLGALAPALNGQVDKLVAQFRLGAPAIQSACDEALGRLSLGGRADDAGDLLWEACRRQARPRLDDLARRIEPAATWHDLVLPEAERDLLREIGAHVRQRLRVHEAWGFGGTGERGLGVSALFAGGSGTGKTMAAEVLANELRLDLYHIDLSAVVSKYIGETEKNLRRIFDAAEAGGAILLFDEADALFGKRSEVKDSHDRHANIEVSYLLQRMEAYRGLAILTTNMKSALDTAFLRRLRFVVQFPFPDTAQRAEIWRRAFPAATPTAGLDPAKLARLSVAGGNIRSIALHAAFLAADEDAPVEMRHLLRAARGEYVRLERALTAGEIAGWV